MVRPLLVVSIAALLAGSAVASTFSFSDEKLVGWSETGDSWVTITSENDESSLVVHRAGREALQFCSSLSEPPARCEPRRDLDIELERVDLTGHPKLRELGLIRLNPRMRSVFKMFYRLEVGDLRDHDRCVKDFTIVPRIPVPAIKVEAPHCLKKVIGGFVHPKARHLLVKLSMEWEDTEVDYRSSYGEISYQLIER